MRTAFECIAIACAVAALTVIGLYLDRPPGWFNTGLLGLVVAMYLWISARMYLAVGPRGPGAGRQTIAVIDSAVVGMAVLATGLFGGMIAHLLVFGSQGYFESVH